MVKPFIRGILLGLCVVWSRLFLLGVRMGCGIVTVEGLLSWGSVCFRCSRMGVVLVVFSSV